jgi:hypothetical protein
MAVAADAHTAAVTEVAAAATMTITNLTTSAAANGIAVHLVCGSQGTAFPAGLTVTWDPTGANQAFTQIAGTLFADSNDTTVGAIYGLIAPASSGNKNIVISWTGNNEMHATAASFTGVNQTSIAAAFPNGTNNTAATGTTATVTPTSATGDIATACFSQNVGNFTVTNGTTIALSNVGPNSGIASNFIAGPTTALTATISTSARWNAYGCDIAAAAAAVASGEAGGQIYRLQRGPGWRWRAPPKGYVRKRGLLLKAA